MGAIPDCYEQSNATGVGIYSSNSSECNTTLTFRHITVADAVEPYLYSSSNHSTCGDMIDEVYTGVWDPLGLARPFMFDDPITSRPSLRIAPLQPPYALQVFTELLVDVVWSLGRMSLFSRTDGCVEADRMFMCGTAYAQPQQQALSALPDLYIPQRASLHTCQQFVTECESNSYNGISIASYELGFGAKVSAMEAYHSHCSLIDNGTNLSWYAAHNETMSFDGVGNITRSPHIVRSPPTQSYPLPLGENICDYYFGTNHHSIHVSEIEEPSDRYADPIVGMMETWYGHTQESCHWDNKVCPKGWKESNDECPYSYAAHHETTQCFKSCYHFSNLIDPLRSPSADEKIDALDVSLLWVTFFLMTYMVLTWLCFKKKEKERCILVLSSLMWTKTVVELYGYIAFSSSAERNCVNKAVPQHHGWNYCAVSGMLKLGLIQPMFLCMIMFLALELYVVTIRNKSQNCLYNKIRELHARGVSWIYYTAFAFFSSFCLKFMPVFVVGQVAGFDGVNSCGYVYYVLSPYSVGSPMPMQEEYHMVMLVNTLDYIFVAFSLSVLSRITWVLWKSYRIRNRKARETVDTDTQVEFNSADSDEMLTSDNNTSDNNTDLENSDSVGGNSSSDNSSDNSGNTVSGAEEVSSEVNTTATTGDSEVEAASPSNDSKRYIFTLAQANVLKTPVLIMLFITCLTLLQLYLWELYLTENREASTSVDFRRVELLSVWNQFKLGCEGPEMVHFTIKYFNNFFKVVTVSPFVLYV